ncbi:MAG TPA: hypothetical protein VGD61_28020 [Pyrinomonadaceae bacterium]
MSVDNKKLITSGQTQANSPSFAVTEPNRVAVVAPNAGAAVPVEPTLLTRAEWPVWSVPKFGWWAGAYSIAFTVVGFFYAFFTAQHHPFRALIVALLLPLVAIVFEHVARCAATIYRRFAQYENLLEVIQRARYALIESRQQLAVSEAVVGDLLVAFAKIEIELVQVYGGVVFLTLRPKKRMTLHIGHKVRVIDFTDGKLMGTFEITQIAPYRAKALGDLNPVWSGYLHQAGAESSAPPNSAAILIEKELKENE